MKKFFPLIFIFGVINLASAALPRRDRDLFSTERQFLPSVPVKKSGAHVRPELLQMRLGFKPIVFANKKDLLGFSFTYENLHFDYNQWDKTGETSHVDTVQSFQPGAFFRHQTSLPAWTFVGFSSLGLTSDFKAITFNGLRATGGALFQKETTTRRYGIGLVLLNDFGRPRVFPAFSYEEVFKERHRVGLRAPTMFSYFYEVNSRWEIGAQMRTRGLNARLEEAGPYKGKNLSYSQSTLGGVVSWKTTSRLTWLLESGWVYRHKLDINEGKKEFRNFDLKESGFVSVAIKVGM